MLDYSTIFTYLMEKSLKCGASENGHCLTVSILAAENEHFNLHFDLNLGVMYLTYFYPGEIWVTLPKIG